MAIDNTVSEEVVETQIEATQLATQASSQDANRRVDNHLWGYLIPCSPTLHRLDFMKGRREYKIGRNASRQIGNDFVLPGMKVSEYAFRSSSLRAGMCCVAQASIRPFSVIVVFNVVYDVCRQ